MRIALISETWLPSVDGVVTRLRHTVSNLIDAGHLVLMIAATLGPPMPGLVQQQIRGIVVPIIDPIRRWALPDRRTIARALDAFDPDIVHVVNPILMGAHALRQVTGRYPSVASFHTDVSAYAARYHLGWTRPILHSITRKAYWRADRRLATSATGTGPTRRARRRRRIDLAAGSRRAPVRPSSGAQPRTGSTVGDPRRSASAGEELRRTGRP